MENLKLISRQSTPVSPNPSFQTEWASVLQNVNAVVTAHSIAENEMDGQIANHSDWLMTLLLLDLDMRGKPLVAKHLQEASDRSMGTVRSMLRRFTGNGFAVCKEKIGRSELYRPTEELRQAVLRWSNDFKKKSRLS